FFPSKEHDIAIDMEWIPRSDNEVADYLSKIVDFDDWGVKDSYFQTVNSIWGPFTVDCFANSVNAKVPSNSSYSALEAAVYGIRWAHDLFGLSNPCNSSL
ncbi:unnamed protein product, partial [Porites evermanni]